MKNDKFKKLELELRDLKEWLKLSLVPKKDVNKHKEEIRTLEAKINEEKEKIELIKESAAGSDEKYTIPKKNPRSSGFEGQPISLDLEDDRSNLTDAGLDLQTESIDLETASFRSEDTDSGEANVSNKDEEYDDPFSDKNRWKRGITDPDADDW